MGLYQRYVAAQGDPRKVARFLGGELFEYNYNGRAALIRSIANSEYEVAQKVVEQVPGLEMKQYERIKGIFEDTETVSVEVRRAGGLHVVGSERHESRRIDNQLRGRAARQGDPGSSRFFLSFEDELMLRFGGLVAEQSLYNLNARMIELEVIPASENYGLGLIPWSLLAGGLLGGVLQKIEAGRRASDQMQKRIDQLRPRLEAWENFCAEIGENPADVALAWLLHNPVVTAPIIGPRTMEQITSSTRALAIKLSTEQLSKLDAMWPGPGGSAPEAYAW